MVRLGTKIYQSDAHPTKLPWFGGWGVLWQGCVGEGVGGGGVRGVISGV